MRNFVRSVCCAAVLASPAAMAGVTGNVGAVSEYVYRGVEQSNGSAVQGGLDWSHASGFYAGTWMSNVAFAGVSTTDDVTYETDVYGGFTMKLSDAVGIDVGLLYYYYRNDTAYNTLEAYVGATFGPVTAKVFYTPEYFGAVDAQGDDAAGLYATVSAALPLSETLTLTPQVGMSAGDGPEVFFGVDTSTGEPDGEYVDYSLTLTKTLDAGMSFSFALIGTNLDTDLYTKDDEKLVVGVKKTFDL